MNKTSLDDLRETLTHARLCYEAWWFIEGENPARDGLLRVYNRYKDFFATAHPALFVTFILKLCSVFDNDERSISLRALPQCELHPDFASLWQRGRKLFQYRSKVIAHRSVSMFERDFVAETGFSYNSIKKLLDDSCELFDTIALRLGIPPTYPFSCTGDLHLMIQDFDECIANDQRIADR